VRAISEAACSRQLSSRFTRGAGYSRRERRGLAISGFGFRIGDVGFDEITGWTGWRGWTHFGFRIADFGLRMFSRQVAKDAKIIGFLFAFAVFAALREVPVADVPIADCGLPGSL